MKAGPTRNPPSAQSCPGEVALNLLPLPHSHREQIADQERGTLTPTPAALPRCDWPFSFFLVGDSERIKQGARRISASILFCFPLHRSGKPHSSWASRASGRNGTRAAQATPIMQQMRSQPTQLPSLAEELDARQEVKCQKREIDLVHDPPARPDETQKSDRSGETSQ
jgi:hypothetical protein